MATGMCHRCCRLRAAGTGFYGRPTGRQEDSPLIHQCLEFCLPCFTLLIVVLLPIMAVYRLWLWFGDSFVFTQSSGGFRPILGGPMPVPWPVRRGPFEYVPNRSRPLADHPVWPGRHSRGGVWDGESGCGVGQNRPEASTRYIQKCRHALFDGLHAHVAERSTLYLLQCLVALNWRRPTSRSPTHTKPPLRHRRMPTGSDRDNFEHIPQLSPMPGRSYLTRNEYVRQVCG